MDTPQLDDVLYPPDPSGVPSDIASATKAYRRHAWLALGALLAFVAVYFGLIGYFVYVLVRLYRSFGGLALLVGLPALFFLGFLGRGLFLVKHGGDPTRVELRRDEQPRLFAYLDALSDRIGAPRAHRVYVTTSVNACVFYDLSFLGFFLPTKKNLEIGLGLVECLTVDELKAVLAHEFGHFAQGTMAVGRWVYVAQQIAAHVVSSRTRFDDALRLLSGIDLRIAWIGWLMRLWVWAIRAVLETLFTIASLAHRALSREMEFQADRVAVSVSGSDSLIHALHRLGPADDAWQVAADFVAREERRGRPVRDLVAVQAAVLGHLRDVLADPTYGVSPTVPASDRASFRVFEDDLAAPPAMWSTHPSNRDRERSAKAQYVASTFDARPAFTLFDDAESLRARASEAFRAVVRKAIAKDGGPTLPEAPPVPLAASLSSLDEQYAVAALSPSFRGAYVDRDVVARAARPADLVGPRSISTREELLARLDALYPESLSTHVERSRSLRREVRLLEGLAEGYLTAPSGVLRHRGRVVPRSDLPAVVADVRSEAAAEMAAVDTHDATARAVHLDVAARLGRGWEASLLGMIQLMHLAGHTGRELGDAIGMLRNVLSVVLADGRVSSAEHARLLTAAGEVHRALAAAHAHTPSITMPEPVLARLERREVLPTFRRGLTLPPPTQDNLGEWLGVVEGHVAAALHGFAAIAEETLDVLLESEETVAAALRGGFEVPEAPTPASVPSSYATCLEGSERPRQKKLDWWDRFQVADGFGPGALRFGVAIALLAPAMFVAIADATATVHIVNGFSSRVVVTSGSQRIVIPPRGHTVVELPGERRLVLVARAEDGHTVDRVETEPLERTGSYTFNPGRGALLYVAYASYGSVEERAAEFPPITSFRRNLEDTVFAAPPRSRNAEGHESVLNLVPNSMNALERVAVLGPGRPADAFVASHILHERIGTAALRTWLGLAHVGPVARAAVMARADEAPADLDLDLAVLGQLGAAARDARCAAKRSTFASVRPSAMRVRWDLQCATDQAARAEISQASCGRFGEDAEVAMACADGAAVAGDYAAAHAALVDAYAHVPRRSRDDASLYAELMRLRQVDMAIHQVDPGVPTRTEDEGIPFGAAGLSMVLTGPASDDEGGYLAALRALHAGAIERARTAAQSRDVSAIHRGTLTVLLGLSHGATGDDEAAAAGVEPSELPTTALFGLLGLQLRLGIDPSRTLAELSTVLHADHHEAVSACAAAPPDARSACFDALRPTVPLRLRGALSLWLRAYEGPRGAGSYDAEVATHLLLAERPYLGPP